MKKILAIAVLLFTMASCGVGTYSYNSGRAEKAGISFVAEKKYHVTVSVDGTEYTVNTIKLKAYRKDRRIKETTQNTIIVTPGKHEIIVKKDGKQVLKDLIFLSNNESKIIKL